VLATGPANQASLFHYIDRPRRNGDEHIGLYQPAFQLPRQAVSALADTLVFDVVGLGKGRADESVHQRAHRTGIGYAKGVGGVHRSGKKSSGGETDQGGQYGGKRTSKANHATDSCAMQSQGGR